MKTIQTLLDESAARHSHLCPRQVLGVRMGMLAADLLGIDLPQSDKRLVVISETYGCTVDGIEVSTGCSAGARTLYFEDYGKVAASFIDSQTGQAVRLVPLDSARVEAAVFAPEANGDWQAQLLGYQRMPAERLFRIQRIELVTPLELILSRPSARAVCEACGEEIKNERERVVGGQVLCRACAGPAYYRACEEPAGEVPFAFSR